MTTALPGELRTLFDRFLTTEYTTIDRRGQPVTWPVTPFLAADGRIDISTAIGYPRKAHAARANPLVSLLFSDPTGSGLTGTPMVLVQGIAEVDDRDLDANRRRYERDSAGKATGIQVPRALRPLLGWHYTRIYVHVQPERIFVWRGGDPAREPELLDTHMEEVRSGRPQEPERPHAGPSDAGASWAERLGQLGTRHRTAVLSIACPDGFPFSARVPVSAERETGLVRIGSEPVGMPLQPGLACLTAHEHGPRLEWLRNFQVRGSLIEDERGWAVVPHRLLGGVELPPGPTIERYTTNLAKAARFRRTARRELTRRGTPA